MIGPEVEVIVPKTDADVERLVKETMEFLDRNHSSMSEPGIRLAIENARAYKMPFLRPFTNEEMRNRW